MWNGSRNWWDNQQLMVIATKSFNLGFIPRTYMAKGGNGFSTNCSTIKGKSMFHMIQNFLILAER